MNLPPLPTLSGYEWRPARPMDAEAIHRLLQAVEATDQRGWLDSLDEVRQYFEDPISDAETGSLLALTPQGQVAALGWIFSAPVGQDEYVAYLMGDIHPEHRRRGLGEAVFSWTEARAAQILATRPADKPHRLRASCPDGLQDRVALFTRHGFAHVRSAYRMRRDLGQPIPAGPLPEGLSFRSWSPELDASLMAAFNESFADHWGFTPVNQAYWKLWFSGHPNFRPDLTLAAMQGDEMAAFSFNEVRKPEIELSGIQEAWIRDLGTRRPWRGRGLATALLCEAMRRFKAAGFEYAGLGVDTENLTGALRIYERLGFQAIQRSFTFSKSV